MGARGGRRGTQVHEVDNGSATLSWEGSRATVHLDEVESSCVDIEDPTRLEFEYMQHMTCAVDATFAPGTALRVLHLGAAACALPWAWARMRPGSRQVAVEVDAALAALVREWFDLPRSPELRIRVGEGRTVLQAARPGTWQVVCRDAFDHGVVPAHLATLEAARCAHEALVPGGLYLVNAAHGGLCDARPDVAALQEVFPLVVTVADPKVGRSGRRGNVVLVAQKAPEGDEGGIDVDELDRLARRLPLPARINAGAGLSRWRAGARPVRDAEVGWTPTPG
ncbi:fused MFS/spermidine synthase [Schaalia sp. 19OD2882]|uniref:spermidine synthase n=1 Tax=Schaalia sp. 19OD2882 TaxID=2794089 RepID=UPI001C1EB25A|nr:fused MFS/spermidine synthase [Schaalia sp. 19OD2882]QWW18950.1 fused MFS/spermidine synthase [Schaalia sp. 19OD2882]